jgi:hypothetical protein
VSGNPPALDNVTGDMWMTRGTRSVVAVLLSLASLSAAGCTATQGSNESASSPSSQTSSSSEAPNACIDTAEATRETIAGTPMWARFCPGPEGRTSPAEVPSDALTSHLDALVELVELDEGEVPREARCGPWGRSYRVQVGYSDGQVVSIAGQTDPECAGKLTVNGVRVGGPDTLGVYGLLMRAFGQQYADDFDSTPSDEPLDCPKDPRKPDSVDIDGPSTSLDTGYHLGQRTPMIMPLSAVKGIVCTWPFADKAAQPEVRDLTAEQAERVRIGLHAIAGGIVDCGSSPRPTYTAVVEDKTGTRRAVTIIDSECSTIIRSDNGGGLGFAWLDR